MKYPFIKTMIAACAAITLAACGGGGSSSSTTATATQSQSALSISGTAATGMAMSGATIEIKCHTAAATVTTGADGTYSATINGASFPCLLEVTAPATGFKYHSVAMESSTTATVNITPLTEMLVARLLRRDLAAFFAAFDYAVFANAVTPATIKAAQDDIAASLAGVIDTSSVPNFISSPLRAATSQNASSGDAHDRLLDMIAATLIREQYILFINALWVNTNIVSVSQYAMANQGGAVLANQFIRQGGLTWMPNSLVRSGLMPFVSWTNANAYCTTTAINGQSGWRLPTQAELRSLHQSGVVDAAIRAGSTSWNYFFTWSSTPSGTGSHYSVDLYPLSGESNSVEDTGYGNVTCVR